MIQLTRDVHHEWLYHNYQTKCWFLVSNFQCLPLGSSPHKHTTQGDPRHNGCARTFTALSAALGLGSDLAPSGRGRASMRYNASAASACGRVSDKIGRATIACASDAPSEVRVQSSEPLLGIWMVSWYLGTIMVQSNFNIRSGKSGRKTRFSRKQKDVRSLDQQIC